MKMYPVGPKPVVWTDRRDGGNGHFPQVWRCT